MSTMKMTRQEVRDEHREAEGSGEVKGRMRRLQRELSRRRMLRDVERATVVITNPTHFAVALEYRRETMTAPRVVAKGADHLAQRIRERALAHGVPIVENKPLARSLYATADVGDVIPAPLFAAVAEVLAYLVRVKRVML
jgi:flagellar biosynthetic protein FlhB